MKTLSARNITKKFMLGDNEVQALQGVTVEIDKGEFVSITGFSGSGKSTLMHILGCLDVPSSGEYFIDDVAVTSADRDELARIRNKKIGFVFQKFYLLPDLTASENVALPQLYAGVSEQEAAQKAEVLLEKVGLSHRADHYPFQLSGGQQQRVAIARALSNEPSIILADEPTGNLDSTTGDAIMDLFCELNTKHQTTIIIVTHEPLVAERTKRVIELIDGKIKRDYPVEKKEHLATSSSQETAHDSTNQEKKT